MKTSLFAFLFALLILSGVIFYMGYLKSVTDELSDLTEAVSLAAREENWASCLDQCEKLEKKWENVETILSIFTNHNELDDIEMTITEIRAGIDFKDAEKVFVISSKLKVLIDHLAGNEYPSHKNILKTNTNKIKKTYDVITDRFYGRLYRLCAESERI